MNKRMKTLGRLLAAVTSLAILLSMTAFAEGNNDSASSTPTASVEPSLVPLRRSLRPRTMKALKPLRPN